MKTSLDSASIQFKGIYVIRAQKVQLSAVRRSFPRVFLRLAKRGVLTIVIHMAVTDGPKRTNTRTKYSACLSNQKLTSDRLTLC